MVKEILTGIIIIGLKLGGGGGMWENSNFPAWQINLSDAGFFVDFPILKRTKLETELDYTFIQYHLSGESIPENTKLTFSNLRTYLLLTYRVIYNLNIKAGINFDTQLNGKLEKQSTTYDISRENLGTETYIVIGVDYRFKITKRLLLIPELKFLYNVSVKGSNVFENHVNIGAGYILNFSGGKKK